MRSRVFRVPVWLLLTGIVAVSAGIRLWLVRGMVAPFIFVDELYYSELAKSLWESGSFAVRGVPLHGYSLTYPTLVAPAWGLFDDGVTAYNVAKSINAVVMSLAAIPTYFLAARVVRPPLALLAAAIAVAVPSMAYTGTITTECVFYPVALLFALALVVYLERPSRRSLVVVFAALALAYATRSQALVFVPVLATAPLVLALVRGSRHGLRRFVPLWLVLGLVPVLGMIVLVVLGRSPLDLLGTYRSVGEQHYDVGQILRFWLWHVEVMTLYVAIVPVVALGILLVRSRSLPERVQVHVAATATTFVWSTFAVAMFASRFASDRVQDRYLFFLTPLLVIALVAWVELGAPRPRPAYAIGAIALVLTLVFPYTRFIGEPAKSDTLSLIPLWAFQEHLLAGSWWGTVALAGIAFLALFFLVRARHAYVVPLVLLGLFVVLSRPVWTSDKGFVYAGKGALRQGITAPSRTWIDDAVGDRGEVVALYTRNADRFTVQMNEFFNRSVGQVLYTKTSTPGGVGETHVAVSRERPPTGELVPVYGNSLYERPPSTYPGRRIIAPFALVDSSVDPVGKAWARDKTLGMTVWKLDGPLADLTAIRGLYPYPDTWSGRVVTWQRVRCERGALVVGVHSDPNLFHGKQTLVARSSMPGVAPVVARIPVSVDTHTVVVPVAPDDQGVCRVRFTITPTANPSKVIPGSNDDRVLGMHFESFRYLPARSE